MRWKCLLAAVLGLGLAAVVGGQPPSDKKPVGPTIEQLVEQLGDNDFRKRDAAARLLRAEGVKALPVLRKALNHPDAEVRRRLVELIPAIETDASLAPRRVTLKAKDRPLKEIFDELTKQTGYKFEYYLNEPQPGATKYSFDFDNVTFWEAIERVGRATGLGLQHGWGDDRVRLQPMNGVGTSAFAYNDGAFRFMPTGFQLYKYVDLTQAQNATRSQSLTLTFAVQSEPKLPILGIGQPHLTVAFDSEKNSMLLPQHDQGLNEWEGRRGHWTTRYGNGNRMYYAQTQVQLARPSEKATTLKQIRGTVPLVLLHEQVPHVVAANVLEGAGKKVTVGTTTVHVEEVKELQNNQFSLKLTFTEDTGGNPNDYSWQNAVYQRLEVHDAKGLKYQMYNQNWGNQTPNSLQMTLTYGPVPDPMGKAVKPVKPVSLVFQEWKMMNHELKFEFKDLPLP